MPNGNLRQLSPTILSPKRFSHGAAAARQLASPTHGNGHYCRDSTTSVRVSVAASVMAALLALGGWVPGARLAAGGADTPETKGAGWTLLFDGRTLGDWQPVEGLGTRASVQDGSLVLESLPGWNAVHWRTDVPKENYEFAYEAMRKSGQGDFGTLAFAIGGATHCMLHIGTGDGRTVGLSLVDGKDYKSNGTATTLDLRNGQWYAVRLQVTKDRVLAWIGDQQVVDQPRAGHRFAPKTHITRRIKAFGLCSLKSVAAVRNIRLRRLSGGKDTPVPADLYAKAIAKLHPLWQSRLYAVALTRAKKLAAESEYAASPKVAKSIQGDAEALAAFWQTVRAGAAKLKPGAPFRMRGMLCKVEVGGHLIKLLTRGGVWV